jgi:hypothetical protein
VADGDAVVRRGGGGTASAAGGRRAAGGAGAAELPRKMNAAEEGREEDTVSHARSRGRWQGRRTQRSRLRAVQRVFFPDKLYSAEGFWEEPGIQFHCCMSASMLCLLHSQGRICIWPALF